MASCIWNTSASPNRALELLQSLPTHALLCGNPSSDHLWMMHSSAFLYTFIYTECAHTHPEETRFHHSDFYTLSSFLNDFLHAMALAFSEEPCPVFSSKTRCNGGEQARQNCQRFSPDFPMTTLHPSLAPLSACFSLSPLGAH